MRKQLTLLTLFITIISFGQDTNYRFTFTLSENSNLFWKTAFTEIAAPQQYDYRNYKNELYNAEYTKPSFSRAIGFGFNINWLNGPKFVLSQQVNFSKGTYHDEVNLQLIDNGDGDTIANQYNLYSSNIPIGTTGVANFYGTEINYKIDLIGLYKLKGNYRIGGGISYYGIHRSSDLPYREIGYVPKQLPRGQQFYHAQYIGLTGRFEKHWNTFGVFVSATQSVKATKSESKKGNIISLGDYTLAPTSMNLDFRLPTVFQIGISYQFDRIK